MRKYFISVLILTLSFDLFGQSRTISGYVRDLTNGESLIGATVFDRKQNKGSISNNFGFYSISSPNDSAVVSISFVGYEPQTFKIKLNRDTTLVVLLRNKVLDEVVIVGTREETINESTRMATVNVPTAQVKAIPAFMGEVDVLKAMQLLPGVSGGAEGSSNLIIRGGNPEQTLILMDGATIYNPTHLYGFFSTFNPDAVNNIELIKGGFPARYGGRLSGIANITLKDGNTNKLDGEGSLGLIASRFMVEGPIKNNKTSFIVSGRRGYMGLMKTQIQNRIGGAGLTDSYFFYDLNAKINHRIDEKNRIYGSIYTGKDFADANQSYRQDNMLPDGNGGEYRAVQTTTRTDMISWKNTVASIRWNHEISNRLFFNVSGIYSSYHMEIDHSNKYHSERYPPGTVIDYVWSYNYSSQIRDLGLKIDFDYLPNTSHYIRFGGAITRHTFNPGVGLASSNDPDFVVQPNRQRSTPLEANVYVEDDYSITNSTKVNFGVHTVAYRATTKTYFGAQPRLSIRQSITPTLSVKGSYSYMQQYVHMLTNAGLGMPTDFWVPVTDNIKPQSAHQFALALAKDVNKKIEITLEGYYKSMNGLVEYKDGASYLNTSEYWDKKVEQGQGKSYGVELFAQKKTGRFTGWIGYTLAWNKRQFDNINGGEWFYYRYDHRHDFKITGTYNINNHWDVSSTFIYTSGNAVSMPLNVYPFSSNIGDPNPYFYFLQAYERRNNLRMPPYHRLDVSATYKFRMRNKDHKITVAIYNVYDRLNPFYIELTERDGRRYIRTVSLFPLLPSVSYSIKF
jgi:outer membrane receptor for ferrienterochelin and colicin